MYASDRYISDRAPLRPSSCVLATFYSLLSCLALSLALALAQQTSINTIKVGKQRYSTYLIKGHNVMPWRYGGRGRMAASGWRMADADGGWRIRMTPSPTEMRSRCRQSRESTEARNQSASHSIPEKSRKCETKSWILLLQFMEYFLYFLIFLIQNRSTTN